MMQKISTNYMTYKVNVAYFGPVIKIEGDVIGKPMFNIVSVLGSDDPYEDRWYVPGHHRIGEMAWLAPETITTKELKAWAQRVGYPVKFEIELRHKRRGR